MFLNGQKGKNAINMKMIHWLLIQLLSLATLTVKQFSVLHGFPGSPEFDHLVKKVRKLLLQIQKQIKHHKVSYVIFSSQYVNKYASSFCVSSYQIKIYGNFTNTYNIIMLVKCANSYTIFLMQKSSIIFNVSEMYWNRKKNDSFDHATSLTNIQ